MDAFHYSISNLSVYLPEAKFKKVVLAIAVAGFVSACGSGGDVGNKDNSLAGTNPTSNIDTGSESATDTVPVTDIGAATDSVSITDSGTSTDSVTTAETTTLEETGVPVVTDTTANTDTSTDTGNTTSIDTPGGNGDSGNVVDESVDADGNTTDSNVDPVRTGRFLDSPVSNLRFEAGNYSGMTNQRGEFSYSDGDEIVFSIGGVNFPAIPAKEIVTPLDIFSTQSIDDAEVINLTRLLQAIDNDNDPENGIAIQASAHLIPENSGLDFTLTEGFELNAVTVLNSAGVDIDSLPGDGLALTHLSNTLINNQLLDREILENANYIADDQTGATLDLTDTDNDSIADVFDWDDDNDGVPDVMDLFPLNAVEAFDLDGDGVGDNADEDIDNDGVNNTDDHFPNIATESADTDGDGFGDNLDTDDDNDGALDIFDHFPLNFDEQFDTDGDGIGNVLDNDDDGDGVIDTEDAFSLLASETLDSDSDGIGDNLDFDDDNDGVTDSQDVFPRDPAEQFDTDGDSIGNNADEDDDNDGVDDVSDIFPLLASESMDFDQDGLGDNFDPDDDNDSVTDRYDAFPFNADESRDSDRDGIGDNADTDDDNDGTPDDTDQFPRDKNDSVDTDSDGYPDIVDDDNDNDGVFDLLDLYPLDATEAFDSDQDGIGNNADTDDDNDDVPDAEDAFPENPAESVDTDGDGIGNNADWDDDNDTVEDYWDDFPLDPTEDRDTDNDGIGNNTDTDDDNDGVLDENDAYPLSASRGVDTDGDGQENYLDDDDDNDGVQDWYDLFPLDATEWSDFDGDGIGNNSDEDNDGDGVNNTEDGAPFNADCSDTADTVGGECVSSLLENITQVEIGDDGIAYMIDGETNAIFRYDLAIDDWLDPVEVDSFSEIGTELNVVSYSADHDRLYMGFSSGVVAYLDSTTAESVYLQTLTFDIGRIAMAGTMTMFFEGYYSYGASAVLNDQGTVLVNDDGYSDTPSHSVWIESDNRLVFVDTWGDLGSFIVDQTTGIVSDRSSAPYYSYYNYEPPLTMSPDGTTLLLGDGQLVDVEDFSTLGRFVIDITDAHWSTEDGLVALTEFEDNTVLTRYTNDYALVEAAEFSGVPLGIYLADGSYYVLTKTDDGHTVGTFTPSDDADDDLVLNLDDAFPLDSAASIDSDLDGSPDEWNAGFTEADSTSGLVLDAYPNDAACYLEADGDGTSCDYSKTIPAQAPDAFVSTDDGSAFLLYRSENLIYRWDGVEKDFIEPLYVGVTTPIGSESPGVISYSAESQRIYLGYDNGWVNYVSLDGTSVGETTLVTSTAAVSSIADAGSFIRVDLSSYSSGAAYYDHEGNLTHTISYSDDSDYYVWNDTTRKLYYTDGYRLEYEYVNTAGEVTQTESSSSYYDYDMDGRLLISPDGLSVLVGGGVYFDSTSLESTGAISRSFDAGVWLDTQLVIVKASGVGGELAYYDESLAPVSSETLTAKPIGLFKNGDELILFTYSQTDGTEVTVITP